MNLEGLVEGVASSRRYFLKHLANLPGEAWAYKPFPECMNLLETLVHLRIDDLTAAESIETLDEPDYSVTDSHYSDMAKGKDFLIESLNQSHAKLLSLIPSPRT